MKVYTSSPTQWWDEWFWASRVNAPSCTVLEPNPQQRFSGLLDANGDKLMVTEQTEPIGFVVFKTGESA
jgi:hypothetical protein